MILHRFDEAIHQANRALKLDPMKPLILGFYAAVMNYAGDHQSAIAHAEKALSIDPDHGFTKGQLANAYFAVGDYDGWYEIFRTQLSWTDNEYLEYLDSIYQEQGFPAVIEERIKVNEEVKNSGGRIGIANQGHRYCMLKEYDKAMDYFEQAYELHIPDIAYSSLYFYEYEQLKDNPRYIQLLRKMNLPLPVKDLELPHFLNRITIHAVSPSAFLPTLFSEFLHVTYR